MRERIKDIIQALYGVLAIFYVFEKSNLLDFSSTRKGNRHLILFIQAIYFISLPYTIWNEDNGLPFWVVFPL